MGKGRGACACACACSCVCVSVCLSVVSRWLRLIHNHQCQKQPAPPLSPPPRLARGGPHLAVAVDPGGQAVVRNHAGKLILQVLGVAKAGISEGAKGVDSSVILSRIYMTLQSSLLSSFLLPPSLSVCHTLCLSLFPMYTHLHGCVKGGGHGAEVERLVGCKVL